MVSLIMQLASTLLAIAATTLGSPMPEPGRVKVSEDLTLKASTVPNPNNNWAGVAVGPIDTTFVSVQGSFIVPTPKPPPGASATGQTLWGGSAWVGIDGVTKNEGGLFQAGISWEVSIADNGTLNTVYAAWYEWFPALSMNFGVPFDISPGDTITAVCAVFNATYGDCAVVNESTGQTVSTGISSPSEAANLISKHAEWIVEDFDLGYSPIPFADFGKVEWFNCVAVMRPPGDVNNNTGNLTYVYPKDGQQDTIVQGKALTNTTTSLDKMTVSYIG